MEKSREVNQPISGALIMNNYQRMHYALSIAFARGLLDGEQLAELLAIYKGEKWKTLILAA